jgi:putative CocE/NonD family hydrolase
MITNRLARFLILLLAMPGAGLAAEEVLIKTRDGVTLSAIYERPPGNERVPTLYEHTIYAQPDWARKQVAEIAARGYAGIVCFSRGKYQSPDKIVPYEPEAVDTHAVLDWIARQTWSDGRVGMIGGSYSGFTAWAATKRKHPALKAIAVSSASIPGQGLPMQNNIFLSANYAWAFHVTNNKLTDDVVNDDRDRWRRMTFDWFASGRPYREIDAVDGTPNPWLQRWLQHPDFDRFWQSMGPYEGDFSHIRIPALTITGYYDDGQITALEYFKKHVELQRDAEHYLVIGPYDHPGTHAREKAAELRGYVIDPVAQMDSAELKLAFMDYVLLGKPKPQLLSDRVNYEVMGANQWRHSASLGAMHGIPMRFYFSDQKDEGLYSLANRQPPGRTRVVHEVDLANRRLFHNYHSYPAQIVQGPLQYVTESIFASPPFETAATIMGEFEGELAVVINKRDFDLGVTLFEAMPDGRLFFLASGTQRASYSQGSSGSREKRRLLTPGKEQRVKFRTTLVSRQMLPGSRLLALVDVNKNPMAQVNYGTGKDVSDESIEDAGEPLRLEIVSGSYLEVPLDNTVAKQKPAAAQ